MRKSSVLGFMVLLAITVTATGAGFAADKKNPVADDIRVKAEVDKGFLTIGDLVTYIVTIEHGPDIRILSSIPAPESDILEIKKVEDLRKKEKKKIVEGRKFVLTTFRLGEFVLDPVTVRYQQDGQPEKTITTNKLYLTVKSVAGEAPQEDIRDVKSVVPFALRLRKLFWVLGILLAVLAGFLIYRRFLKKKAAAETETSPLTAEEEALRQLTELFESDLIKRGLIKMYYLRLSEILRVYFERRYKILAVESTTIETLRALRTLRLESGLYQKIQATLEAADLAKFAKWVPTAPEVMRLSKNSEEIIKESVPVLSNTLAAGGPS
ncbi:MAG TPA: hypothetical protein PLL75_05470 [Candidatus Omnitrophota bacterium]|nr:hypothetical protein [Candidatus Omnitrophota bacterium]